MNLFCKLFLLTTILFPSYRCFSQFYLGYTEYEVIVRAQEKGGKKIRKRLDDDANKHIAWEDYTMNCTFDAVFTNETVSNLFILPYDEKSASVLALVFNRNYDKISKGKWKAYPQGIEVDIVFGQLPSGRYYFRVTLAD